MITGVMTPAVRPGARRLVAAVSFARDAPIPESATVATITAAFVKLSIVLDCQSVRFRSRIVLSARHHDIV